MEPSKMTLSQIESRLDELRQEQESTKDACGEESEEIQQEIDELENAIDNGDYADFDPN